jgi:hypothetical protein
MKHTFRKADLFRFWLMRMRTAVHSGAAEIERAYGDVDIGVTIADIAIPLDLIFKRFQDLLPYAQCRQCRGNACACQGKGWLTQLEVTACHSAKANTPTSAAATSPTEKSVE